MSNDPTEAASCQQRVSAGVWIMLSNCHSVVPHISSPVTCDHITAFICPLPHPLDYHTSRCLDVRTCSAAPRRQMTRGHARIHSTYRALLLQLINTSASSGMISRSTARVIWDAHAACNASEAVRGEDCAVRESHNINIRKRGDRGRRGERLRGIRRLRSQQTLRNPTVTAFCRPIPARVQESCYSERACTKLQTNTC